MLERKYLNKFYHFLKYVENEMMYGFQTKEIIRKDWINKYDSKISNFVVGAERIIYSLFNGKGIGQPNSSPVGSDMFFELDDAYIHIDLKTVQTRNIGDITTSIFVGRNQNSYKSEIKRSDGSSFDPVRMYEPALPTFYNEGKVNEKICLTYFITILYEDINFNILNINFLSMPNGSLYECYGEKILRAGKNPDKTRFNLVNSKTFEFLSVNNSRIKVVYFDKGMSEVFRKKLYLYEKIYDKQNKNLLFRK